MSKRILLADDSITIQKVVSLTLAAGDYDLIITGDGESAVRKAREEKPDLVIADISMPGKNGYEVCSVIKNDPELSEIPVLLLAGTFEPIDDKEASRVGADDHIVKPFESEDFINKIGGLLSRPARRPIPTMPPQVEPAKPSVIPTIPAVPPVPVPEEKPQILEDIWEAGDFLGTSEEEEILEPQPVEEFGGFDFLEEVKEKKPEPKPEIKKEAPEGFFDLEFAEEEAKPEIKPPAAPPALPRIIKEEPMPKAEEKIEIKEEVAFESFESAEPAAFAEGPPLIPSVTQRIESKVKEAVEEEVSLGAIPKEKLEEMITKIAREVIEEIAWEVVPELAEEIIKTEFLDRVKQAMARQK